VALLAVPAAFADAGSSPAAVCKALQKTAPALFGSGKTYRNLGACVSAKAGQAAQNTANAANACKAEQADPNFASSHGGKTFAEFYGTALGNGQGNGNGQGHGNAFGKCVSGKAQAKAVAQNQAQLNAAKQCKMQRADPAFAGAHGGKSFSDFYGTNANKRNAFGKCVSTLAKKGP
jgi:hypothetical protein